jgi:inner membrane protein
MEQVTQAVLGALFGHVAAAPALGRRAAIAGAVAGLLPDADVFLEPLADPAFPIELHRGPTHALAFVPVGAGLTTLLFLVMPSWRLRVGAVYAAAFAGWLSHAPLDACTSYGTRLWWPFSDAWVAWDLVAILDPLFTLMLFVGLYLAVRRRRVRPAVVALALACAYLTFGGVQRDRALAAQQALADARGDRIERGRAMPVLGSVLLWRSVYASGDVLRADALRLLPFAEADVAPAGTLPRVTPADVPHLSPRDAATFARFFAFADGLVGVDPAVPEVAGDHRYSLTPGFSPLWGMALPHGAPARWTHHMRFERGALATLARTVFGTASAWRPLPAVVAAERQP